MTSQPNEQADFPARHIAVVVSRFPKFTETFVVNEILAFDRMGWRVEIFPLLPPEAGPHQPAAGALMPRARFGRTWGMPSVGALVRTLGRRPRATGAIIGRLIRDTWRHPRFLVKDAVLLPRVCAIAEEMRSIGVTHVHAHFATHAGFAAWAIGRLTGLPYSIVAHGSDVHRHQAMLGTKVAEAQFVATVSEYNRQVILSVSPDDAAGKVVVVRNGVDLSAAQESDQPAAQSITGELPTVLCVGTLHEVKGQAHLIRAVGELAERGRAVRVELLGDGEDRHGLESLAAAVGVEDRVRFRGAVPHGEVLASYRGAAAVVTPSVESSDGRKEGMPTVLLESMATGVPVIASDLAGIAELVEHEHTGLLVPPGDHLALADAIERLLGDTALADRLRRAGRRRVVEEYDIARTSAHMASLIAGGPMGAEAHRA